MEICKLMMRQGLLLLVLWGLSCAVDSSLLAQNSGSTGTLTGKVTDADDKLPLIGVNVVIKGSSLGSSSNLDGLYSIARIPAGQYQVEVSYLGYEKKIYTGVRIEGGKPASLNIVLRRSAVTMDQEVVVVGDKPLIDLEQTKTEQRVGQESIEAAPTRSVQSVLNTQAGVMLNPEGLSIRGGRTYETAFMIDGASATDPLAGTGFGIDLGTNSIDRMDIATGGGDVTQGDGSAGIVRTKTRSGGDRWAYSLAARSDQLGFNKAWSSVWNNQVVEGTLGGSLKGLFPQPLRIFSSFKGSFDDQYFRTPAKQVQSSLYPNPGFSPMQDNRWAGMLKVDYAFHPGLRLSGTYLRS
ncbi:MAG: carboxypeptidase-like regulatory domain-containing protein, partial [Bacteroidota bacterium]